VVEDFLQIDVYISTIGHFLATNRFTRQKLRHITLQRDAFERAQYASDISVYSTDIFVFIDETGADRRNLLHKHGYSARGRSPVNH